MHQITVFHEGIEFTSPTGNGDHAKIADLISDQFADGRTFTLALECGGTLVVGPEAAKNMVLLVDDLGPDKEDGDE